MERKWLRQKEIAAEYKICPTQIRRIRKEIESCPRYKGHWIYLNEGGWPLINRQVWEDYLHYRNIIRHGLERTLPKFGR